MTTSTYDVIKYTDLNTILASTMASINSAFSQAVLESWISEAERMVYSITGTEPSSAVPFDVMAVTMLSERIAINNLILKGYVESDVKVPLLKDILKDLMTMHEFAQKSKKTENINDILTYYKS